MENTDRTGKLIQAYNQDAEEIGLFKIMGNNCPMDHFQEVIKQYFEETDESNADLGLFRWGLERVYIDYLVDI